MKKILAVDDSTSMRQMVSFTLQTAGYEVHVAADGSEALTLAKQTQFDLVISDINMPVMDGITAAEQIVAARIAPVLMMTAFSQRALVERARDAGAMAYLVKPFSLPDLVPAIEIAVTRHQEIIALEGEVADLGERLAARKAIDRAKAILMEHQHLSESESFKTIQRRAMDQRSTMGEVAKSLIEEFGN